MTLSKHCRAFLELTVAWCPILLRGLDSNQEYLAPKASVLPLNDPALIVFLVTITGYQFFVLCRNSLKKLVILSGRRELNPLSSPWQGDILPVNYARFLSKRTLLYKVSIYLPTRVHHAPKVILLVPRLGIVQVDS